MKVHVLSTIAGALAAILSLYPIGYFALGEVADPCMGGIGRVYPTQWLCEIYLPAAEFESLFRSDDGVYVGCSAGEPD